VSSIDVEDDWEYRRLVELVEECMPQALKIFIALGYKSKNDEIREAAIEFKNKHKFADQ
jgi:hypothetical protein